MDTNTTDAREEIHTAAVLCEDGTVLTTPRPGRHHTILNGLARLGAPTPTSAYLEQGFVTSRGRFVDREEAARIALDAGQPTRSPIRRQLFSEDLW